MIKREKSRLQFVHCETLFKTREDAIAYVNGDTITINRPALYAEPMVLKYGDAEDPNIMLAIGSIGDGVTQSLKNKVFFIDIADLNESDELIARKLEEEIARAKSEEARIESKNTLHINKTNSITHEVVREDEGVTLSSNVNLAKQYFYDGKILSNNMILDTENGLWASFEVKEGNNTIEFKVNGVVTEIPNVRLENGEYSKEKEAFILKMSDGKEIEVSAEDLIGEWGVLSENEQKTPVVLKKTNKSYDDSVRDKSFQDILSAELRISENPLNTLTLDDTYGLLVKKSTLRYDNAKNELVFNNGLKEEVIALNSGAILNKAYYEASSNSLVLIFKLENNETEEIKIPVSDFAVKINTLNVGRNVTLVASYDTKTNTHNLSADVNISNVANNILKTDGNSLYVLGTSDNIKHGNSTVFSELNDLLTKNNALEVKLNEEIAKLSNGESSVVQTVTENREAIQNEINRAQLKEDELSNLLTQEINRAKDAEFENKSNIVSLTERLEALNATHDKDDSNVKGLISSLQGKVDEITNKNSTQDTELTSLSERISTLDSKLTDSTDVLKSYVDNKTDNITLSVESTNSVVLSSTDNVIKANVKVDDSKFNTLRVNNNGLFINVDFDFNESTHELTYTINDKVKTIDLTPFKFVENIHANENGEMIVDFVLQDGSTNSFTFSLTDKLSESLDNVSSDLKNQETKIVDLELLLNNKLSEKEVLINSINTEISSLSNKINSNSQKISALESNDNSLLERITTAEVNVVNLSSKYDENKSRLDEQHSSISSLGGRATTLEANVGALDVKVNEQYSSIMALTEKVTIAEGTAENLREKIDENKSRLDDQYSSFSSLDSRATTLESNVGALDVKVNEQYSSIMKLTEKVTISEGTAENLREKIDENKSRLDDQYSSFSSLDSRATTLESNVGALDVKVNEQYSSIMKLTEKVTISEGTAENLREKIDENLSRISEQYSSISSLDSRATTLEANVGTLEVRVNDQHNSIASLTERTTTNEVEINNLKEKVNDYKLTVKDTNSIDLTVNSENELEANIKLDNSENNIIKLDTNGLSANVSLTYDNLTGKLYFNNGKEERTYTIAAQSLVYDVAYNNVGDLILKIRTANGSEEEVVVKIDKLEGGSEGNSPVIVKVSDTQQGVKKVTASLNVSTNKNNLIVSNDGSLFASKVASDHLGTYRDSEMTMQEILGRIASEIDSKGEASNGNGTVDVNLQNQVNTLQSTVMGLSSSNTTLTSKVSNLDSKVTKLEEDIKLIDGAEGILELSSQVSELDSKVTKLEEDIKNLGGGSGDVNIPTDFEDRVSTLESKVSSLESADITLQNRVSVLENSMGDVPGVTHNFDLGVY